MSNVQLYAIAIAYSVSALVVLMSNLVLYLALANKLDRMAGDLESAFTKIEVMVNSLRDEVGSPHNSVRSSIYFQLGRLEKAVELLESART